MIKSHEYFQVYINVSGTTLSEDNVWYLEDIQMDKTIHDKNNKNVDD